MDGMNVGRWLIDFAMSIIEIFQSIWALLSTPIVIAEITIFGWEIFGGITFTPLQASPYIIGVIVVVSIVGLFIPTN
jgi:hypothetical protein